MDEQTRMIGPYRLIQRIGRGAMGEVFQAEDSRSGAPAAVKLMAAELSEDPELIERFRREAVSAAMLDHPNITRVYEFGEDSRQMYMAMELLDGRDLKQIIEQGTASVDLIQKLAIMAQVASGMAFVHARALVHRDIKPANIHLTADGQAKIMDFGLVRLGDSNITRTGMVLGSPSYMAPELIRGEKADARSDVFSLGAVFYELLCGRRAFPGKALAQIMMAVLNNEPQPIALYAPEVPAAVSRIVERCLRKTPEERYQTAGELWAAMEIAQIAYG